MKKVKRDCGQKEDSIKSKTRCVLDDEEMNFLQMVLQSVSKELNQEIHVYYRCFDSATDFAIESFKVIIGDITNLIWNVNEFPERECYIQKGNKKIALSHRFINLEKINEHISEKLYNYCLAQAAINNSEICKLIIEEPIDELFRTYCENIARRQEHDKKELVILDKVGHKTYGFVVSFTKSSTTITNKKDFAKNNNINYSWDSPWVNFRNIPQKNNSIEANIDGYKEVYGAGLNSYKFLENYKYKVIEGYSYGQLDWRYASDAEYNSKWTSAGDGFILPYANE